MLTALTLASSALALVVGVLGVWLAIWSYQRLSITVFLWIGGTKLVGAVLAMLLVPSDAPKMELAERQIRVLAERNEVPLTQAFLFIMQLSQFFPLLVTLLLGLIAGSEVTHIVSRCDPRFLPPTFFQLVYRIRWVFGLLAILATVAPSAILDRVLSLLP
jgi:hypothetical protein